MSTINHTIKLSSGETQKYSVEGQKPLFELEEKYSNVGSIKKIIERSTIYPRFRLFVLDHDETICYQIPNEDIISGGSYSENYQTGSRRTLSFSLDNSTQKYSPSIDGLYIDTKVALEVGLEVPQEGITIWFKKGVFLINNISPSKTTDGKTVSVDLVDKFSVFEGKFGTVPVATEVPVGTDIQSVLQDILSSDRGNGMVLDPMPMFYHPSFNGKKTPQTINMSAGDSWSRIITQISEILSAEIFYDSEGCLNVVPRVDVITDAAKPDIYDFDVDTGNVFEEQFSLGMSDVVNCVYVVGASTDGHTCLALAENNSPSSGISIERIGRRMLLVQDTSITTDDLALQRAEYELRQKSILSTQLSTKVPFNPLLSVNNIVTFTDRELDMNKERYILQSLSFSLSYDGTCSLTVSKVNDFDEIEARLDKTGEYKVLIESNMNNANNVETIIHDGEILTFKFKASGSGYKTPLDTYSIRASGATFKYRRDDDENCSLTISKPTGNIKVLMNAFPVTVGIWSQYNEKIATWSESKVTYWENHDHYYDKKTGWTEFKNFSEPVTRLVFPSSEGTTGRIGNNSFNNCGALISADIYNFRTIGQFAFANCYNLRTVDMPYIQNIEIAAFQSCGFRDITFPSTLKTIGNDAFYFCTNLRSVTFEGTPDSIAERAFALCTNLSDIYVPWQEGQIPNAPWGAKNATIHYGTPGIYAALYDGDGNVIDTYNNSGLNVNSQSLTNVNYKTSTIGGYYVTHTKYPGRTVKRITIPVNQTLTVTITRIGNYMFRDCETLESVLIPKAVDNIGLYAFNGCTGLKYIDYLGTKDEWTAITKSSAWKKNIGHTFEVRCTDGTIIEEVEA